MSSFNRFIFIFLLVFGLLHATTAVSEPAGNNEEELFLVAQKAFDDGFYDVAIRYINQFTEEYPQTAKRVQAQLLLGQCYFFKKQYLKAYDIFQGLLNTPEFKDATLFWLGETYFKGADYKQARKYYQQLIDVYPNSEYLPQARYSLAWTYYEEGDYEKAKTNFAQFLEKYPHHALYEDAAFKIGECEYNLGLPEMASQYFRNYIIQFPKSTRLPKAFFYIAESQYYLEDYPAAITYYAKVADIAYDQKLKLLSKISMGWSYMKLEKYELSLKYFDEAMALSQQYNIPSDDIYLGRASLFVKMNENEKARQAYKKLIENFPNSPRIDEAHLGKANMDYLLGDYPQAIREYQGIIDTYGQKADYRETLEKALYGIAWTYLKSGDVTEAVRHFKDILDNSTNDVVKVSVLTQIGDAYQDTGDLNKAIETYDRILKDYPDSHYTDYVQFRQGIALLKRDKIEAAMLSFQSLQANFPGSKYLNDVKYYLGLSYYKKENWNQAIHYFEAYLNGLPRKSEFVSESRYLRALSYFNIEDFNKALELFQNLLKDYKDNNTIAPVAAYYAAKCYSQLGQDKEAIKNFKSIPELYPATDAAQDALTWLGDTYLQQSDFENAIFYYKQYLDKFPGGENVPLVQFEIGQAYQVLGQWDKALSYYKLIGEGADKDIYAKARLAIADIFSQQVDAETAIKNYNDIIKAVPDFQRDAYLQIARIHEKDKKYSLAIEDYTKALKADKSTSDVKDAELQFDIADSYEVLNDSQKAVDEYLKIPYLHPQDTTWVIKAYLRAARIFEDNEDWEEAQLIYRKILNYKAEEAKYAQERLDWIKKNTGH